MPFIKARARAVGRSPPSAVIEASALKAGADDQRRHQFKADDARDEAEGAAQSGQYPRWRRQDEALRLPGGPAVDTRRHARTCARTDRLSALTHLFPTFRPGMGRPSRVYPFASARWDVFSPIFLSTRTRSDTGWSSFASARWRSP
jgi:hypothetical protein